MSLHFDVSDMILTPVFIFGHHFFICFMKMCSPLEQEAHFRFSALFISMQVSSIHVLFPTPASQFVFSSTHGPFRIRTLARDLCTINILGPNCKHSWQHRMCFLCINSSPKHSRADQRGANPAKSKPDSANISPDQPKTISDQSKTSQEQVKNCSNQQISSQFRPSSLIGRS